MVASLAMAASTWIEKRRTWVRLLALALAAPLLGGLLAGCPGFPGSTPPPPSQGANPLAFVYPANGQKGLLAAVEPIVIFPAQMDANALDSALVLEDTAGNQVQITVMAESLKPAKADNPARTVAKICTGTVVAGQCTPTLLKWGTTYTLKTTATLSAGSDSFKAGQVLTQFTTRTRPGAPATAAAGGPGLHAIAHSPGGNSGNGVGNNFEFARFSYQPRSTPDPTKDYGNAVGNPVNLFNTLHVTFSEALDPATVVLGKTLTVVNGAGVSVAGRLYVQGNEVSFQPLEAADSYNIKFTAGVKALNGDALQPDGQSDFVVKVNADATYVNAPPEPSQAADPNFRPDPYTVREFLKIVPGDPASQEKSSLNGDKINSINVAARLIGTNQVNAMDDPGRGELVAFIGQDKFGGLPDPHHPGDANHRVLPVAIPAGTQLASTGLNVTLYKQPDGTGVNAQLKTGPLTITVLDTANAYFFQNPNRRDGQPTAVVMHLDMTMAGTDPNGNAVLNQTVLNVTAVGTVRAFKGQLFANAVAQIPLQLANTATAIATLNLQLVLPSKMSSDQAKHCHLNPLLKDGQCPAKPDTTPPTVLAYSPSACFYAFGSGNDPSNSTGSAPAKGPAATCSAGGVAANDFPVDGGPFVLFSEPVDPTTLAGANGIQLMQAGTAVPSTAKVEGTSVVLYPEAPLQPNTQYTVQVGTGLRDLAGNPVALGASPTQAASSQSFTTAPYATTAPAPVFVTTINPGLPCALDPASGDFTTGGNKAGYCLGDNPASGNHQVFNVFPLQANLPLAAYFTKPVESATIVAADGCLTAGSGPAATKGSFAVETVDASGQCTGVVDGAIRLAHAGASTTRFFHFLPAQNLEVGQRYWLVVCGTQNSVCSTSQRITDVDGMALNTTPVVNSGSGANPVAATPDMIEPFVAIAPTQDYRIVLQAQPATDTNGNGRKDAGEKAQSGTDSTLSLSLAGIPIPSALTGYLSGDRPIEIQGLTTACNGVPDAAVGSAAKSPCLPFFLSAGGMFTLTGVNVSLATALSPLQNPPATIAGLLSGIPSGGGLPATLTALVTNLTSTLADPQQAAAQLSATLTQLLGSLSNLSGTTPLQGISLASTGRVILRLQGCTPGSSADCTPLQGASTVVTGGSVLPHQAGYILNECIGSINGRAYDFKPCIATTLNLAVNAPDSVGLTVPQNVLMTTLVGPLTFTDSGRMVTQLANVNAIQLSATALGLLPATATIAPGQLHLQLSGYPVHGH